MFQPRRGIGSGHGTNAKKLSGKSSEKSGALYKVAVTTGDKKGAATDAKVKHWLHNSQLCLDQQTELYIIAFEY